MIDISIVRNSFKELSVKYGVSVFQVEEYFLNALIDHYKTQNIQYKSKGLVVNGKYKNISSKSMKVIKEVFSNSLISAYRNNSKSYCENIIAYNSNIIYCKMISENTHSYLLQPYASKNTPIKYFNVRVKKSKIIFPVHLNLIPVYIKNKSIFAIGKNMHQAEGLIIENTTIDFHLKKLEKLFLKNINVKIELKREKYNYEVPFILISSSSKLNTGNIRYISKYFQAFGLYVKFKKNLNFNI